MNLSELGEKALIERFRRHTVGIGDDCAVIGQRDLVSTDLLIEGVHFERKTHTAEDIGHKVLAVNLSDIAAMGGCPKSVFLSMALSPQLEVAWVDEFFQGFSALLKKFDVKFRGGDTTRSPGPLVFNLTILGEVPRGCKAKLRSGARLGDLIA